MILMYLIIISGKHGSISIVLKPVMQIKLAFLTVPYTILKVSEGRYDEDN